jgi:hypothetical protein
MTRKCSECPLAVQAINCPGEYSQTICDGKFDKYKDFLLQYPFAAESNTIQIKHESDTNGKSKERLEICSLCEHYDAVGIRCKLCGCNLLMKTILEYEHCPISKW